MRIGIDIDGVLTNIEQYGVDYLSKYCVENNIDFKITCSNYNIAKAFNIEDKYTKIIKSLQNPCSPSSPGGRLKVQPCSTGPHSPESQPLYPREG